MARRAPKREATDERPALTDAEADYVILRIEWALRRMLPPVEFYQSFGHGAAVGVADEDRERVRALVRLFVRPAGR